MTVKTFTQPDYADVAQTGSIYPTNIDKAIAVHHRVAGAFAAHEQAAPNMTVRIDAGAVLASGALVEIAAQSTGTIVAPVSNPRIDRIVIDQTTGAVSVVAGVEAGSPVAPAIPSGQLPVARVALATSTASITNALITDERVGMPPAVVAATSMVRQTVLSGAIGTAGGRAQHISGGAGLNYNVAATAVPLVVTYGNGFGAGGSVDLVARLTADAANQGALTANALNFLHSTYVSASAVTWGNCLVRPQYGYTFDRAQGALLNFEGSNGATTTLDAFGNTWTLTGATISTAQFKYGASSLTLNGTTNYAKSTDFVSLGGDSWEMSVWFRPNGFAAAQTLVQLGNAGNWGVGIDLNTSGKAVVSLSSSGTGNDIANAVGGLATFVANQWHRVRLVFDAVGGTYKLYQSINGAAESVDTIATSALNICACEQLVLGATNAGTQFYGGYLDAFRLLRAAPNNGTVTPGATAPAITDQPVHWYSIPAGQMYEATAASAAAATNPTFTARNRVFHGEAETNGTVCAVLRSYAYQGKFVQKVASWTSGTGYTFAHQIGVVPEVVHAWAEVTSAKGGLPVGMRLGLYAGQTYVTGNQDRLTNMHGSTALYTRLMAPVYLETADSTGAYSGLNPAGFTALVIAASRGW